MTPLGKALRNLRMDRGWLAKEMADGIGVAPSFLSSVERGKKNPPEDFIDKIAKWGRLTNKEEEDLVKAYSETVSEFTLKVPIKMQAPDREAAAILARSFGDLTSDQLETIRNILKKRS